MPLSQRFGDALSIFLPANSVYLDLDNPPDEPPDEPGSAPPPHSTTTTTATATHSDLGASAVDSESAPADDDPFAPASPSVLSHSSPSHPHPASSPHDPRAATPPHADQPFALDVDARDPFYDEPVPPSPGRSRSRSPSPTPTSSVVQPRDHAQHRAGRSPPSSFASSSSKGRMGASRSAIGTRSLMGLMGGTRYEGQGFPFGGVGVGEVDEDEDEDEEPDADLVRAAEPPRPRSRCVLALLSSLPCEPSLTHS